MFIEPSEFLTRFDSSLNNVSRIRIVSAWVTENPLLDLIEDRSESGSISVQTIAGTSSNLSHPDALARLLRIGDGELKLGNSLSPRGIFHPKLYIFDAGDSEKMWIGSANFTNGGFPTRVCDGNFEVVFETNVIEQVRECNTWFDNLWSKLAYADDQTIKDYRSCWNKRRPTKAQKKAAGIPTVEHPMDLNLIERRHLRSILRIMSENDASRVRFGTTGRFGRSEAGARPNFQIQPREEDREVAFKGRRRFNKLFKSSNLTEPYEIDEITAAVERH